MSIPVLTFFNNKGGVGKTSLVYHLAWMYAELGLRVIAADLDPQANLTAAFLNEEQLEELFNHPGNGRTISDFVAPLKRGIGDIATPYVQEIEDAERLGLLVGDLALSGFEDQLSETWPKCLDREERAFRVTSAFWRILQKAAEAHQADMILVDLGPNLGAINRAVLIATDYVVVPLAPDLFSLQGLHNLGPTLRTWRSAWQERLKHNPEHGLILPSGHMQPIGYIVLQHAVRLDRPVRAYERWIARIPQVYRNDVLQEPEADHVTIRNDPHALALLKNYGALKPIAQEARKPMFRLKSADGAIGSHLHAVQKIFVEFRELARTITKKTGIPLPEREG